MSAFWSGEKIPWPCSESNHNPSINQPVASSVHYPRSQTFPWGTVGHWSTSIRIVSLSAEIWNQDFLNMKQVCYYLLNCNVWWSLKKQTQHKVRIQNLSHMAESDAKSRWHLGWQSGTRKESSPIASAFPCQYYSTNDPHSFIHSFLHPFIHLKLTLYLSQFTVLLKNFTTREALYTGMKHWGVFSVLSTCHSSHLALYQLIPQ